MFITNSLFHPKLVDIYQGNENFESLVQFVEQKLLAENFINESYSDAIIQREAEYPTGLQTPTCAVAIPHTDPNHIKEPFIYILKLAHPVKFGQMGTTDQFVNADYAFFLGFNKGEDQLTLLQNLMAMFMDQAAMLDLASKENETEIFNLITNFFKKESEEKE
ncbi:PTS sugar transporter subunit IIA [Enterococcus sp. AZ103]|uniref:PTS sugar transporter subunit IIA n=1 Tax=Enterococcus sp. AZ103 TaxID=2774628 RepID=UPI003F1E829F